MSAVRWTITEENLLAVYDVALDIRADLQLGQTPCIPMVPSLVKFRSLMPMDSIDMRDRYGNLRWKAMKYLESTDVIQNIKLIEHGHRWKTQAELQVNQGSFNTVFAELEAEVRRRNKSDKSEETPHLVEDDL